MNILNRLKAQETKKNSSIVGLIKKNNEEAINSADIEIGGTYTDNYDIMSIHHTIIKKLKGEGRYRIPKIESEIENLKQSRLKFRKIVDKRGCDDKIELLEKEMQKLIGDDRIEEYRKSVGEYLDVYSKTQDSRDNVEIQRRIDAIEGYLRVASKYAKIDLTRTLPDYFLCESCGFDLRDVDDDANICPECGSTIKKYVDTREVYAENISSNYGSMGSSSVLGDDSRNFKDTLKRFQGKESVNIPPTLYTALDSYFDSVKYKTGEQVRQQPLLPDGTKEGTSKHMLGEALKKKGLSKYYENESYICREYWGWQLPELSRYEEIILDMYTEFQRCYQNFKGFDRKSSLSTQVILWLILVNLGIPCTKLDFRLVEIEKTVNYYRQVLDDCTHHLKWKNIPL